MVKHRYSNKVITASLVVFTIIFSLLMNASIVLADDGPTEVPPTEEVLPTEETEEDPTEEPTDVVTEEPTEEPIEEPTEVPSVEPTDEPAEVPTEEVLPEEPVEEPTEEAAPTLEPTPTVTETPEVISIAAAPVLSTPSGTITDNTPTYTWSKVTGATHYQLDVYNSAWSLVESRVMSSGICSTSSCSTTPSTPLPTGYFRWRVRAYLNGSWADYSSDKVFRVYIAPTPISPSGTINDTTPTYKWSKISGATYYQYQVYNASWALVKSVVVSSSICSTTTCSTTPSTALTEGYYRFRVRAYLNGSWADYSSDKVFKVIPIRKWTFMVYLDGDNNLESAALDDFLEMSSVGSTNDVNIVVQFDRSGSYATTYDNWTDTRRYYVTKNMTPSAANGTSIGEQNMGSGTTLLNFVNWAKTNYPANRYALIVWDHGGGFQPASDEVGSRGVAWDDTSSSDYLSNKELSTVLSSVTSAGANKLELVGFDACLMAQMEVHEHVKNYANYGVGSEETEPGDGWPYDTILTDLKNFPNWTGASLASDIVNKYYASYSNNQTQSAVRYGAYYSAVDTRLNNLAAAMISALNSSSGSSYRTAIGNALTATRKFSRSGYVDLSDFALQLANRTSSSSAVHVAADNLIAAISNDVINSKVGTSWSRAKGISIYFPLNGTEWATWAASYQTNQWLASNTQWNEFLNEYYNTNITITLTWGSNVPDLDSHLWLPSTNQYHVKWTTKGSLTSFPYAKLDVDDTSYYGPENISIAEMYPGTYQYNVYEWSSPSYYTYLKYSGAKVVVYRNGTLVKTLYVSSAGGTASGRWWRVFTYNANTNTFTWVNSLSTTPGAAYSNYTSSDDGDDNAVIRSGKPIEP